MAIKYGFNCLTGNFEMFDPRVQVSVNDRSLGYLNGKLVAGTGITLTENNNGGNETLGISTTITQYTDEQAQDAVGAMIGNTATINLSYVDATPALSAFVNNGSITFAKMQDVATGVLLGRNTALTGSIEAITDIPTAITIGSAYIYRVGGTDVAVTDGGTGVSALGSVTAGSTKITLGGTPTNSVINSFSIDVNQANLDHGSIGGLSDDDHSIYVLLAGRAGGQTLKGGINAGDDLTITSTNNLTKGNIFFGAIGTVDEVNGRFGIGTTSPSFLLQVNNVTGDLLHIGTTEIVVNESSQDIDFRVESDSETNLFHVDSGLSTVGIGAAALSTSKIYAIWVKSDITGNTARFDGQFNYTVDETIFNKALYGYCRVQVASGKTNNGYAMGMDFEVLRDISDTTDVGTLYQLIGERINFGNYSTHANAITNEIIGLQLNPYIRAGKVGTVYSLYITAINAGGTLTGTNYSIYQDETTATNCFRGGVICGSPTGGNKGTGTLNATAVYDDNVLLTDYIFDLYYDGRVKEEDEDEHKETVLWTIEEISEFTKINRHLPTMVGRKEWKANGKKSLGQLVTQLWETVEQQQIQIFELKKLIK